jgi:hypothetical protein
MRFSVRSKVSIFVSLLTILTLVSAFMVVVTGHATASHAASRLAGPAYHGIPTQGQLVKTWQGHASGNTVRHASANRPQMVSLRSPQTGVGAPVSKTTVNSDPASAKFGGAVHAFNGLSDLDQATANGDPVLADVTPPDQGLCIGNDASLSGNPKAVFETINDAVRETDVNGNLLFPDLSFANFFGDPNAFSDPRCFYDPQNGAFFFTVISSASFGGNDSFDDVLVINASGSFALYQFSTSEVGTCFGDQPHTGYDNNALYVTTDQFCNTGYLGGLLIAISMPDLVNEVVSPHAVSFTNLTLNSIPVLTLEPAVTVGGSNIEYLENSFPYDALGNSISADNQIGLWTVTNDSAISTLPLTVTLSATTITSEEYFFPVPAQSTGNGSITTVCDPAQPSICVPVQSEQFLNPDDDRMLQVEALNQNGTIQLWSALDTALSVAGDTQTRDGAAWFEINPVAQSVTQQGYVALAGDNLLYPAIFRSTSGLTTMTFTITGVGGKVALNPSAAWINLSASLPAISLVAQGAGPHKSFSGPLFDEPRWGDYSAATLDPNNGGVWMATEYIPSAPHQALFDNWGTFVFQVD